MSRAMIVLNSKAERERAAAWAHKLPPGTRIEFKAPRRTLPQNDLFWAVLTDVARQCSVNGRRFITEEWKLMFLTAYAEETGLEIKYLPAVHRAGMVPSSRSSSDLSVKEMSELIEWIFAWGTEQDPPVIWSEPKAQREDAA